MLPPQKSTTESTSPYYTAAALPTAQTNILAPRESAAVDAHTPTPPKDLGSPGYCQTMNRMATPVGGSRTSAPCTMQFL